MNGMCGNQSRTEQADLAQAFQRPLTVLFLGISNFLRSFVQVQMNRHMTLFG